MTRYPLTLTILSALFTLAAACAGIAHGAPVSVYFIAGQSNAVGFAPSAGLPAYLVDQPDVFYRGTTGPMVDGLQATGPTFGPELSFARSMSDATGEQVAVVKVAWGSTSLAVDWQADAGKRYLQFVARMDSTLNALRSWGFTPTVRGGVWVQGEEDAFYGPMAQAYGANLADLMASMRSHWGAELPIAIARINAPYRSYRDDVRAAEWSAGDALTSVWDTDDLPLLDKVHYSQAGQVRLGQRMAAGLLGMRYQAATLGTRPHAVPEPRTEDLLLIGLLIVGAMTLGGSPRRRR